MSIPVEIKERIFAAADRLYELLGRESFPTVDAVRREAKTDMNAASAVMKEWRKTQTAAPIAVAVAVPETLSKASTELLAGVWTQAQALANESLKLAESAWASERAEYDAMRAELADAHDAQSRELDGLALRIAAAEVESRQVAEAHAEQVQGLHEKINAADSALHESREAHAHTKAQQEMLSEQFAAQSQRLQETDAALQSANLKSAALDEKLVGAESKAKVLESQVEALTARALAAEAKVEAQAALVAKAQADAEAASKRADDTVLKAAEKVDSAQSAVSAAEQRAAHAEGKVEALEKQLAALVKALEKVEAAGHVDKA